MGFISFNEKYYKQQLLKFENKSLSSKEIYEVKQVLKVLDDLEDEGYTKLNQHMENTFSCISRLRTIIKKSGERPFELSKNRLPETTYDNNEYELEALLEDIKNIAKYQKIDPYNPFLDDIKGYCDWIGYDKDTAYIFLLRDALLPYLYYKSKGRVNLYPWLISRKFLQKITHTKDIDDNIRLPIYEALERGYIDFKSYHSFCKEQILKVLEKHTKLKRVLIELLKSINTKNIIIVESGYCGTIPMMLSALDNRISFKLYTTAPFLYDTYQSNIYCKKYEDVRLFETLYSHNLLLQYSSFHNGNFYVSKSNNNDVIKQSLAEIKYMIK